MIPPIDRRLRLLLLVTAMALAVVAVLVTPYNLLWTETGMLYPYEPPPLSALRPLREAMLRLLPVALVAALLNAALLSLIAAWRLRRAGKRREAANAVVLIAALGLAAAGQAAGHIREYTGAGALYAAAGCGFVIWAHCCRARLTLALKPLRLDRRAEVAALLLVMALTAGARFYELRSIPYGIEGDEAKWTAEVAGAMIDQRHVFAGDWHYGGVPGSFYMQAPFHRLFGPSLLSARIAVATYSVLATLVFYGLARAVFNAPVALLATFFMSVSLVDLSASRQALVEGHVKLWAIAGPALLWLALRYRRVWLFALAGAGFGLGIVTYDTYLPMLGVGGALLLVETLFSLRAETARRETARRETARREAAARVWGRWLASWAAFLAGLGVFLGRAMLYIGGRGHDYRLDDLGWTTQPAQTFLLGLGRVLRVFVEQVDRDFLHTREGPLINGLLVPLAALGVAGCLVLWRRRAARLPLIWAALVFFPAPIVLLVAYPRVLYVGLPALYILAALGAFWALRTLWAWAGRLGKRALLVALGVGALAYPVLNLYIYFNETHESFYDVTYREMSDFLAHYAGEGRLILIPFAPLQGDIVERAEPWFNFVLRQRFAEGTQGRFYRIVPYDDLFVAMTDAIDAYDSVALTSYRTLEQMSES